VTVSGRIPRGGFPASGREKWGSAGRLGGSRLSLDFCFIADHTRASGSVWPLNDNLTVSFGNTDGDAIMFRARMTITPTNGVTGNFTIKLSVGASSTSTGYDVDSETISVVVGPNTAPTLAPSSPSLNFVPGTAKTISLIGVDCRVDDNGIEFNFGERGLRPNKVSRRLFLASTSSVAQAIAMVDAPPTIDLSRSAAGTGYTTHFVPGGSGVAIAGPDAVIADSDSPLIGGMTVTISNRRDGDLEGLTVDTSGTSITSSYANGVLTLSGVADAATYQTVLKTIKYTNSASTPKAGNRTILVTAFDGINFSQTSISTVILAGQQPPVNRPRLRTGR
jgi:hypothetical protein